MHIILLICISFINLGDEKGSLILIGKPMGQIHKENHLLATKILEFEQNLPNSENYFLSKFTHQVYFHKIRNREELKKSIKLYENLKSEIDKTTKGITLESIYCQPQFNDESIKSKLLKAVKKELTDLKY